MAHMLQYVLAQLQHRVNFDQAQGLLALVLRVHGGRIAAQPALGELAMELHAQLAGAWAAIDEDMHAVKCMVAMFGGMQM